MVFFALTFRPRDCILPSHIWTWRLNSSYEYPDLEIVFILPTHTQTRSLNYSYSYPDQEIALFLSISRTRDCIFSTHIQSTGYSSYLNSPFSYLDHIQTSKCIFTSHSWTWRFYSSYSQLDLENVFFLCIFRPRDCIYSPYSYPGLGIVFFLLISRPGDCILTTHIQTQGLYFSYSYSDQEIALFLSISRTRDCIIPIHILPIFSVTVRGLEKVEITVRGLEKIEIQK